MLPFQYAVSRVSIGNTYTAAKIPASSIPADAIKDIILELLKDPEFVDKLQWALALHEESIDKRNP